MSSIHSLLREAESLLASLPDPARQTRHAHVLQQECRRLHDIMQAFADKASLSYAAQGLRLAIMQAQDLLRPAQDTPRVRVFA